MATPAHPTAFATWIWLCLLAVSLSRASPAQEAEQLLPVPNLTGRVNDEAGILRAAEKASLTTELRALEEATSVQLVLLTVPSLGGKSIDAYSLHVAEAWALGQRGLNNGMLIVVAPNERRVRIEVGTGLEWQVPDSAAATIVKMMVPYFKRGDYAGGLGLGVEELASRASSVNWTVDHRSLEEIARLRPAPAGQILRFRARFTRISRSEAEIETEAGRSRLLLPVHWSGLTQQPAEGESWTVFGRIVSWEPLTLRALGVTQH